MCVCARVPSCVFFLMANQDLQAVQAVQAAHGTRKPTPGVADKGLKGADKVCFYILHPALLKNTAAQLVEFRAAYGPDCFRVFGCFCCGGL